ncbi:hypothetical protein B9Z19DRAFT_975201 [Tuber borchii]|uniref:Branchpoint-bridging protein n=1 Tax=Tuber borchii TaxID=42251 RepID=A0A2T6ZY14_TUBBO|nr:hypothetical protein B9Z19DRAFT_975201 [Tuber borchii]
MWINTARVTGTNTIPIGKKRRLPGLMNSAEDKTPLIAPSSNQWISPSSLEIEGGVVETASKKFAKTVNYASFNDASFANIKPADEDDMPRGRQMLRRNTAENHPKSRWGSKSIKSTLRLDNLPTSIPLCMSPEDTDTHALKVRIQEITQRLANKSAAPYDKRSLSPAPIYDVTGRRINSREIRYRKLLEAELHDLVAKVSQINPVYKPPGHYKKRFTKYEKIYIPVDDYPGINFAGSLIGPRGNTIKHIQKESGAKVILQGKGFVKPGQVMSDSALASNQEEDDIHCLIISCNPASVLKAREMINENIETAKSALETFNPFKRDQLRELATLNGTLRDDEGKTCSNCGEVGHRRYDCPKEINYAARIICRVCGNGGHFARNCFYRPRGGELQENFSNSNSRDQEYESFIQDVLGDAKPTQSLIAASPTRPSLQKAGDRQLEQSLIVAQAPWTRVGRHLVKACELDSIVIQTQRRLANGSPVRIHEIREHPIPRDYHQAPSGHQAPNGHQAPSGHHAPSGQSRPWLEIGSSASEGPGSMGQFQNIGNRSSGNPLAPPTFLESIGYRRRAIRVEAQPKATGDPSPQNYPGEYNRLRDAQGYNREGMLAHANSYNFQNPISSRNHAAGHDGLQFRHPWNSIHPHRLQAYPTLRGHLGLHQAASEYSFNGLHLRLYPPPPPLEPPPPTPPPPPSYPTGQWLQRP